MVEDLNVKDNRTDENSDTEEPDWQVRVTKDDLARMRSDMNTQSKDFGSNEGDNKFELVSDGKPLEAPRGNGR